MLQGTLLPSEADMPPSQRFFLFLGKDNLIVGIMKESVAGRAVYISVRLSQRAKTNGRVWNVLELPWGVHVCHFTVQPEHFQRLDATEGFLPA